MATHHWKGSHKYRIPPWGARGLCPIRHLNPWDLYQKEMPPKHLTLKTNGAYIQENYRAVGNKDFTLTELECWPTCPRTQREAMVWKEPRLYVKETHLLILKHLQEGENNCWDSLQGWKCWWVPFFPSHSILLAPAYWHHHHGPAKGSDWMPTSLCTATIVSPNVGSAPPLYINDIAPPEVADRHPAPPDAVAAPPSDGGWVNPKRPTSRHIIIKISVS